MDKFEKRFWFWLGLITLVRLAFIGQFELSPDEAYYWTWSRHLDWAYYDQGPMLAVIIRFFTLLVGSSTEWSVRLGSVVLSFFSAWMFFALLRRMFKNTQAAWFGFLAMQASLLFSAGSILMMHDSIMVCFWIAGLLFFYRALFEHWIPGMYLGALALGLGALAKYSMALFVPGLLLFLILSPDHRIWWKKPHLYLAGLITLSLISPLLFWNASHGSATFGHIAGLGGMHKTFSISFKTFFEFVGGQMGVMTPILGALSWGAIAFAWRQWKQRSEFGAGSLYLACFSAPVLIFFGAMSLTTRVYANWPAPAYAGAFGLLAFWIHQQAAKPGMLPAWFKAGWISGAILTLLVHAEVGFGVLPLSGKAADSVDRIRGWRTLGEQAGKHLETLKASGPVFVAARRYQIAAELSFYLPGQPEVQLLPEKTPASNQYRFWDHASELSGQDALFVCEDAWEADHLQAQFKSVEPVEPMTTLFRKRSIRNILFFHAREFEAPGKTTTGFAGLFESDSRL